MSKSSKIIMDKIFKKDFFIGTRIRCFIHYMKERNGYAGDFTVSFGGISGDYD